MDFEKLLAQLREKMNARISARNELSTELGELRAKEDATEADTAKVTELREKKSAIDAELRSLQVEEKALEDEKAADDAATRMAERITPSGTGTGARGTGETRGGEQTRVTEPRTYSRDSDPKGLNFLGDVAGAHLGDDEARQRLAAHKREERTERGEAVVARAVDTGGAPGTIVPQYLIDLYAPKGRPGRKFADACRHHDLPQIGMTAYIPRQVVATSADIQATENTAVDETDYEDELISVPIRTNAGSQTMSRQSAERGVGTEDIVFEDLLRAYNTSLNSTLINAATWGLLAVANTVTYTSGSPTAAELYKKIQQAGANIEDVLLDLDEDDVFTLMRGRRWRWLNSETTDQKPFLQQNGVPSEAFGQNDSTPYGQAVAGFLPDGGDVVKDNSLPNDLGVGTDEDVVVSVARHEAHLWEDPNAPFFIRAEQPKAKSLGIDLVLYGYFAAKFDRVVDEQGTPKAVHQQITGTGLVTPTF